MPGVYTTAINTKTPPVQPIRKKPKVITTAQMDVRVPVGEGGRNSGMSSPLIDLTSRSPSPPSLASAAPTPAQQLSSYAASAQTRVVTTVCPIQSTSSLVLGPLEHNNPSLPSQSRNPSEPMLTCPSSSTIPAGSSSVAIVRATMISSLTHSQSQPGKKLNISRNVENPPPALVDYGDLPTLTDGSVLMTESVQIKREPLPLQYATPLSPSAATSQHSSIVTGTRETVRTTGTANQAPSMPPVVASLSQSSRVSSSVIPSQVGVVSPQVGVDLSEPPDTEEFPPLRIKCSVGDEMEVEQEERDLGEKGLDEATRESGKDEDDGDSVMELRIEEPAADTTTTASETGHLHTQPTVPLTLEMQRVASEAAEHLKEDTEDENGDLTETDSHQNSVGTSPPPSVGVRVHRQVGNIGVMRLMEEDQEPMTESMNLSHIEELGHDSDIVVPSKFPKSVHVDGQASQVSNARSDASLVLKGSTDLGKERVPYSLATVSPLLLRDNDRGSEDGCGAGEREKVMVPSSGHNGDILASYRVRKVAKVKQFFTTLQHFGNRQSSEVADQVQELIAALVNGTATIEEFHQEIQTVTNHPLRQFIIPFLQENLDLFREELRDSEQALSDILGHPPSSSPLTTISVTPQMIDDDLPVLPSSKPPLTPTLSHTHTPLSASSPSLRLTAEPATHVSSLLTTGPAVTVNSTIMQRSVSSQTHSTHSANTMTFEPSDADSAHFSPASRKRQRRLSTDKASMTSDVQNNLSERSLVKRVRPDLSNSQSSSMDTVVMSSSTHRVPAPAYPYPPTLTPHQHTYTSSHSPHDGGLSHPHTSTPSQVHTSQVLHTISGRKQLLSEDWAHVDMMLNSVVGMVDKVRHAVSMLRERALNSSADLEKKELEQEHTVQQRMAEATEKARRLWLEEKQHIQREAGRKLKEAVGQVKLEMEQKIAQAQSLAVQETLKEANTQTNSKESCWNCGRRATETCSGCNKARYCGTFCQHKDWGNHMHQCASGLIGMTDDRSTTSAPQHVVIQAGDARMTSSDITNEPPDIKPRISPEQMMNIPQISVRYPIT